MMKKETQDWHIMLEQTLMNENNFKNAARIDNAVPHTSGIYCLRLADKTKLPALFKKLFSDCNHNILYIGIASKNLNTRFLNQELRAKGHGTFFRSIGAVLGYKPTMGSLTNKKNKRNYKFSPADEIKIIDWINKYVLVNWICFDKEFDTIETALLKKYQPLLNLTKNPSALSELTELRAECRRIANSV